MRVYLFLVLVLGPEASFRFKSEYEIFLHIIDETPEMQHLLLVGWQGEDGLIIQDPYRVINVQLVHDGKKLFSFQLCNMTSSLVKTVSMHWELGYKFLGLVKDTV